MNNTTKKIIIRTIGILGLAIVVYALYGAYFIYDSISGCGMDDGPFKAVEIDQHPISNNSETFDLKNNAELILDNRTDSLSPTLTLKEKGVVLWTLDTDTRKTEGYEHTRIWKITNLRVTNSSDPIEMTFSGHWTFGSEHGSMVIDRNDADNEFCLSW